VISGTAGTVFAAQEIEAMNGALELLRGRKLLPAPEAAQNVRYRMEQEERYMKRILAVIL
jgi:hypothetical protein